MSICAEGVETKEQLAFLESEGCDEVQGFLVGQPMTVGQFEQAFASFNGRIRNTIRETPASTHRLRRRTMYDKPSGSAEIITLR